MTTTSYGEADYIADNYGTCARKTCVCNKGKWLGRACEYWKPATAKTFEEMREQSR